MTIEEKRKALDAHCNGNMLCAGCPLKEWPEIDCSFIDTDDPECWPDERIEEAYEAIFHPTSAVNHPGHYNREGAMECIDEMILIFGKEAVKGFCLCNAWKYRYRAADKNGEEDLKKSDWYLAKYRELMGGDGT